ncbi:competence protein CoiA [Fictibacillus sp. NRS-1165]|uniref:competence protein CoiA n=1 Tax=Fictibacillus sp. NRS-1165 TaxID=3144463 RepID=UPI003D24A01B
MLVAHLITGKRINLLAGYTREKLKSIQNESGFYCPHCKEKVRIKAGNLKIWHFSHLPGLSNCILSSGESIYHLLGKKLLYEQAIKEFPDTLLEPFFSEISQRPDLFIPPDGSIEFQCSTIPAPVFIDRCKGYINCGLTPVWILSKKRLKRLTPPRFKSIRLIGWPHGPTRHVIHCPLFYISVLMKPKFTIFPLLFPLHPHVCMESFILFL